MGEAARPAAASGGAEILKVIDLPPQAIDERLRAVEQAHDLLQYRFDGWCIWPIMRFSLQMFGTTYAMLPGGPQGRRQLGHLDLAAQDVIGWLKLRPARYAAWTATSGLAERAGQAYKDVWFDDLLARLGSARKIEAVNNAAFLPRRQQALIPSDMTTSLLELAAIGLTRLSRLPEAERLAGRLSAALTDAFGSIERLAPRMVYRWILGFYWRKRLYRALLRRLRPAVCLVADPGKYPLVAAAKEQGCRVVELQHGLMDRHHSAYSWTAYARPYRASMPVPDQVFVYGDHWREELAANGFWGEGLRVVGCPRLDQYAQMRPARPAASVCRLLYTTQGLEREPVIDFWRRVLDLARGKVELSLQIKLHPVYDTDKDPYLAAFGDDPRVQVWLGNEGPSTFELLTQASLHASISSTCHYEALGLGVPTLILPFYTHEIVLPLAVEGHAWLAHTPERLVALAVGWRELSVPPEVSTHYYRPGAVDNMVAELERSV